MHNTIKAVAVISLTLICSCSSGKGNLKTKTESVSLENDKYTINYEEFSIEENSEGISALNELFSSEISGWIEDFKVRAESITNQGSSLPCLQVRHTIKQNNDGILSVITEKYVYINGLHGNTWLSAKNFDLKQDKIINLSDLFIDDTYTDILNERINELISNNTETYHDLWEQPTVDKAREDKFYLDGKNLVIFYEPYELSYYARGVVEFPISIEKIRGYIKPEYLSSK